MGQGGYGLDQCYLWFGRDGRAFESDVLLFSFINYDFSRMGKSTFQGYPRPFLELENDALVARNTPVPEAYASAHTFRRLGKFTSELALSRFTKRMLRKTGGGDGAESADPFAFDETVARALFDELRAWCAEDERTLVLVHLPLKGWLAKQPASPNAWVHAYAEETGTPYFDLTDVFSALPPKELAEAYLPDEHYTAAGHDLAARTILERLRGVRPDLFE